MAESQNQDEDKFGCNRNNVDLLEDQTTELKEETVKKEVHEQSGDEEALRQNTIKSEKAGDGEYNAQCNTVNETEDKMKPSAPNDGQTTKSNELPSKNQEEGEKPQKNKEDTKIRVRIRKLELKQDKKSQTEYTFKILQDETVARSELSRFLNNIKYIKDNDRSESSPSYEKAKQPPNIEHTPERAHRVLAVKTDCHKYTIRGVQQRSMYKTIQNIENKGLTVVALDVWCGPPHAIDTRSEANTVLANHGCLKRVVVKGSTVFECSQKCRSNNGNICSQDNICKVVEQFFNREEQEKEEKDGEECSR